MDKNEQVPAEELEQEQKALAEVKEDELREKIVSDFGFDPENDKERIDKLVAKEMDHRKSLSSAIGQKINYRNEVEKLSKAAPPKTEVKLDPEVLNKTVDERFEKFRLEEMEYPDDIKEVISKVAKVNGTSVRQAVSDPYIQAKINDWKKKQDTDEAAITRKNKSGSKAADDIDSPPDVDLSTPEGRKEYDDWKARMIKEGH